MRAKLGEGAAVATDAAEALSADIVATVTPGFEILFDTGSLHAGQHVSLMGADGPGKAEIAVDELLRARVVCDEWEQASHNGEIAHALDHGLKRETSPSSAASSPARRRAAVTSTRSRSSTRPASPCRTSPSRAPSTSAGRSIHKATLSPAWPSSDERPRARPAGLAAWKRGDFEALEELSLPRRRGAPSSPANGTANRETTSCALRRALRAGLHHGPDRAPRGRAGMVILLSHPAEVGGPDWPEETAIAIMFRDGKSSPCRISPRSPMRGGALTEGAGHAAGDTRGVAGGRRRPAAGFLEGLGWQFDSPMPGMDYRMARAADNQGAAVYPAEQRGLMVYYDVDDIDGCVAKVRDSGGSGDDKMPVPGMGWFSQCKDPEGLLRALAVRFVRPDSGGLDRALLEDLVGPLFAHPDALVEAPGVGRVVRVGLERRGVARAA